MRYDELRDKIQAMVSNKIAVSGGPTPMDVGEIAGKGGEGDRWQTGDDWEVDAVWPTSQCHRCGGYGHFARDCATEKGFEKGKGKGGDKGKGKGLQNTPKGVGKGASKGKGGSQKGKRQGIPGNVLELRESRAQSGGMQGSRCRSGGVRGGDRGERRLRQR